MNRAIPITATAATAAITLALPKGRIFDEIIPLLNAAGIDVAEDPEKTRKLIVGTSRPDVRLVMHPGDAEARDVKDGDAIRIFNTLGEVRCNVTVGPWTRPGIVVLPKGLWRRSTVNGYTGSCLVPDTLTDLGGGACFNDARVQVEKCPSAGA